MESYTNITNYPKRKVETWAIQGSGIIEYDPSQKQKQEQIAMISIKADDFKEEIEGRLAEIYFCLDKSGSMTFYINKVTVAIEMLYEKCIERNICDDYHIIPISDTR